MKIKNVLKSIAAVCASAAVMASLSIGASAATIDFEDGKYDPYFTMKTNDGGDQSVLSIEEFNGSKQLKIDVQDCSLLPKLQIHLDKLVGSDHLSDIKKVQLELTIVSKDGTTPPGWIGGDLGSESLDDQVTLGWSDTAYEGGEYENSVAATINVEHKWLLPSKAPQNGTEGITCLLQRWACEVPYYMYVDNVTLLDENGNEISVLASADSAPAPASDSAPASDGASSSATTGNIPAASMAAVAVCAAAVAAAAKKSRKK